MKMLPLLKTLISHRISICRVCEFYDPKEYRCKKCGCWLPVKVYFSCPDNRW